MLWKCACSADANNQHVSVDMHEMYVDPLPGFFLDFWGYDKKVGVWWFIKFGFEFLFTREIAFRATQF